MAKYAFLNFPIHGQVNPTLAMAQELVARGEEVVYFNFERFREAIEATGAAWRPYEAALFRRPRPTGLDDNQRLALLPLGLIKAARQAVPPLLEAVQAEDPDCLVYSDMFLWARIIAHALGLPGISLRPTFASNALVKSVFLQGTAFSSLSGRLPDRLSAELAHLASAYSLPFPDLPALVRGEEGLRIVFLPRVFQPDGDSFDERWLFVGPSFHPQRDKDRPFPFERLGAHPCLYISLGTVYNDKPEFFRTCFEAFGDTGYLVVLSLGSRTDPAALPAVPDNFITSPFVPQLEVLRHTDVFITHGGMNSTMEGLSLGVPLIVIPHMNEQKLTARRVQELGLGLAIDENAVTAGLLLETVSRLTGEGGFKWRAQAMQEEIRAAGGYRRAVDALQGYIRPAGL